MPLLQIPFSFITSDKQKTSCIAIKLAPPRGSKLSQIIILVIVLQMCLWRNTNADVTPTGNHPDENQTNFNLKSFPFTYIPIEKAVRERTEGERINYLSNHDTKLKVETDFQIDEIEGNQSDFSKVLHEKLSLGEWNVPYERLRDEKSTTNGIKSLFSDRSIQDNERSSRQTKNPITIRLKEKINPVIDVLSPVESPVTDYFIKQIVRRETHENDSLTFMKNETEITSEYTTSAPRRATDKPFNRNVTDYDFEDISNETSEDCQFKYCLTYDDYLDLIEQSIYPTTVGWVFICAHIIIFIVGTVGNGLVGIAVYRNHSMRTVTNYFIVNLAIADFMVLIFCLPPSVVWDITGTWFLGEVMCKIVLYMQTVSVTVSVLTLAFISLDRWYAICYPLKFKSTTGRAKTVIIIIWGIALLLDIPELIVLTTVKDTNIDAVYFTQCAVSWSKRSDTIWATAKLVVLYIIPLIFMSFANIKICIVLWRNDGILQVSSGRRRHHSHHQRNNSDNNMGCGGAGGGSSRMSRGCRAPIGVSSGPAAGVNGNGRASRRSTFVMNANSTTESQLRSRRKAVKMLLAVMAMFAVCQLPVHILSLAHLLMIIPPTDFNRSLALFSHWLFYANSAVNPIIYNFMSGKFRKEFHNIFGCASCLQPPGMFRRRRTSVSRSSTYVFRFTAAGGSTNARTELVQLSQLNNQQYRN